MTTMTEDSVPQKEGNRENTLYELNKRFVDQDAALINDVAEQCSYDFHKSYAALVSILGESPLTEQELTETILTEEQQKEPSVVPSEDPVDQQTVPEMPRAAAKASDQSVPNGATSYAARANAPGPKATTGAIRKTNHFNFRHWRKERGPCNTQNIEKVKKLLSEKCKVLVILRGLPGSGKSYLSKELTDMATELNINYQVCSADNYFVKPNGKYEYNPHELTSAHNYCKATAKKAMEVKTPLVIIDNTNVAEWEMQYYIENGVRHRYRIELMEPLTGWRYNPIQLSHKTVHGVPEKTIKNMKDKFQFCSLEQLLENSKLTLRYQRILNDRQLEEQQQVPVTEAAGPEAEVVDAPVKMDDQINNHLVNGESSVEPVEQKPEQEAEESQVMSEGEEEIIDYEGVPESVREFYKELPVLYPHVNAQTLRQLFRECHFDQEYFFDAMDSSAALLAKTPSINLKPTPAPAVKESVVPSKVCEISARQEKKKAPQETSPEVLELKKTLEEKFFIAKRQNHMDFKPTPPPVEKMNLDEDEDEDSSPSTPNSSSSSSEEEEYEMKLDQDFLRNMLCNFGGAYSVDDLPLETFQVKVPASIALQIYCTWMDTVEKNLDERQRELNAQLKNDEALAKSLATHCVEEPDKSPNMDEILEMEKALQAVKNMQMKDSKNDLATKLSLEKLRKEFPNIDNVAIGHVFESSNRDYGEAARILQEQYMTNSGPINVYTPEALKKREEELMQQALEESMRLHQAEVKKKPLFVEVIPVQSHVKSKLEKEKFEREIAKIREKANEERLTKMKHMDSMQQALQKKHYNVASYYKTLVDQCDAQCNMLNYNVSTLVIQNSSLDCLDLHYLHIKEAINAVEIFLDHHVYLKEINSNQRIDKVKIVTGRGRRSQGGIPRLWPAIKKYLDDHKIPYTHDAGSFNLDISKFAQYSKNYSDE